MNWRAAFATVVAFVLIAAAAAGIWYTLVRRPPAFCQLSDRAIHANMRTLALIEGKKLHTCCPRCPLTLASQERKQVRILEVTDYASGEPVRGQEAFFVDGSTMEVCCTPRAKVNEERLPYERLFDRCAPSLLAFSDEDEARVFIAKYGGTLKRLDELMREVTAQQPAAGER